MYEISQIGKRSKALTEKKFYSSLVNQIKSRFTRNLSSFLPQRLTAMSAGGLGCKSQAG